MKECCCLSAMRALARARLKEPVPVELARLSAAEQELRARELGEAWARAPAARMPPGALARKELGQPLAYLRFAVCTPLLRKGHTPPAFRYSR